MTRFRIFTKDAGGYRWLYTGYSQDEAIIPKEAEEISKPGDIIYSSDFYNLVCPNGIYELLSATDPRCVGLYRKATEAEQPTCQSR
jgi:hypothetical protein